MAHQLAASCYFFIHLILILCFFSPSNTSMKLDSEDHTVETSPCNMTCKRMLTDALFQTTDGQELKTLHQECFISVDNSTDDTSCHVDVRNITSGIDMGDKLFFYFINLECTPKRMQVHLINPTGFISKNMVSYLQFTNCNSTFGDMSVFGMAVELRVIVLVNWATGKPEQILSEETGDENKDSSLVKGPIAGLQDINTLSVIQRLPLLPSIPAEFYTHLWPIMAELQITNISSSKDTLNRLRFSMPLLQTLDVEYNPVAALPNFPWANQSPIPLPGNLSRTSAGNDHISIKKGFYILPTLNPRTFSLSNSNISILSTYQFRGSFDLINLASCGLTEIYTSTFEKTLEVQVLILSRNLLRALPVNSFRFLSNLTILKLDNNQIESIEEGAFNGLNKLTILDLQLNKLKMLGSELFSPLRSLKVLNVSLNSISSIAPDVIGLNKDFLGTVDLHDNNISQFSPWMFTIRTLQKIDLSSNHLSFEALLNVLDDLHERNLQMQNQETSSSADEIYKQAYIKKINLQYNNFKKLKFKYIDESTERRRKFLAILNFFELDIEDNPIQCDCDTYTLRQFFIQVRHNMTHYESADFRKPRILPSYFTDWKCSMPQDVKGKPLVDANENSFYSETNITSCPVHCVCLKRAVNTFIVNCTGRMLREMPHTLPLTTDTVLLSHNQISTVKMYPQYRLLKKLDLSFNNIESIDGYEMDHFPKNIQELKLDHNRIKYLPDCFKMLFNVSMSLGANDLHCDCHSKWLARWMVYAKVTDKDQVVCASGKHNGRIFLANEDDFVCELSIGATASISLSVVFVLSLLTIILLYKFRGEIKVLLYFHLKWHPFDRTEDSDVVDKLYDAFISYSAKDVSLVFDVIQPMLETESKPYRLCIHDRDFTPGALVTDNVLNSVKYSRRMIMLLTRNFLKSEWCHLEFQSAHRRVLKDRTNYLVIILFDNIKVDDLDEALKLYLKTNTYILYDSKWFWERLFYAMPERSLAELREERMPSGGYRILMPKPETVTMMKLYRQVRIIDTQNSEKKSPPVVSYDDTPARLLHIEKQNGTALIPPQGVTEGVLV